MGNHMADMTGTIAYSDGDIDTNSSANPTLQELVNQRYSRRSMLMGGVNAASVAVFGSLVAACGDDKDFPVARRAQPQRRQQRHHLLGQAGHAHQLVRPARSRRFRARR